ncbi:phosphoethanolamine transferase domain-containing protein [Polaribacter sp.]|nr:phosphoethanolamine transferase domain-containing protein [Polaribacter sp.]MDC1520613.1 phosphoethanolamine transferase domain-containing protein [Polaribacter sp.]
MEKLKKYKEEIKFHLLLNILFAVFISFASYIHIHLEGSKSYFIYGCHFLILQFSVFGFLYLLSLSKILFRILFPVVFFTLSTISFWVYTQDISINSGMIQAILESNIDIAIDVFSFQFGLFMLFSVIGIIFCIKKYLQLKRNQFGFPLLILSILAISVFFIAENYRYGILKRKLPYSVFYGMKEYLEKPTLKIKKVLQNIRTEKDSLHIVFVLGESV